MPKKSRYRGRTDINISGGVETGGITGPGVAVDAQTASQMVGVAQDFAKQYGASGVSTSLQTATFSNARYANSVL